MRRGQPASRDDDFARALRHCTPDHIERLSGDPCAIQDFADKVAAYVPPPPDTAPTKEQLEQERTEARLRGLDRARLKGRVRRARAEWLSATAGVESHDTTVRRIAESIADAKAKHAALIERQKTAAAQALLGDKAVPDSTRARKAIARETQHIENGEAALALAAPKRGELAAVECEAHANLCDEGHDLIGAGALADLQRARKALAALAPSLASLWASDLVPERLLGDRWSFDLSRVCPISGASVVRIFVNNIPAMLRTSELDEAAIQKAAEKIAEKIIAEVEEGAE